MNYEKLNLKEWCDLCHSIAKEKGFWDKERETALLKQCGEEVEGEVARYLSTPAPTSDAMFEHLYATLPSAMQPQLEEARRFAPGERGGHG